jgi:hypothetical protein
MFCPQLGTNGLIRHQRYQTDYTCSMNMEMQHDKNMDLQHVLVHAAYPSTCYASMSMLHTTTTILFKLLISYLSCISMSMLHV